MPHVNPFHVDASVTRVAQEWEKTPQLVNQLCRAFKYEKDRRNDPSTPQPIGIEPVVWTVWSKWISNFGLLRAHEAAEILSDRLFPRGGKKK